MAETIAVSLVVASIIHALVLFRGFYSATLDESGRTLDAYNWMRGSGSFVTVWLPFYKIVVGGALFLVPDLFVVPRVVSYAFGMAALCSLIWLSHVLFRHRATTLVTGLIGAVLPQRVVLSVAPLAEIMFVAAITLSLGFLARWLSDGGRNDAMLSAALFAVASSIRYEGWVFAGLFAALVMYLWLAPVSPRKLSFITARALILVALSFVALWIVLHLISHGRPFGFVANTVGRYTLIHGHSSMSLLRDNPLAQFALQNVWTLNILGLLSLRSFSRENARHAALAALPALALLAVSTIAFLGKGMPTHGFWRIPSVWSILLVPFTAHWFAVRLSSLDASAKARGAVLVSLLVAVLVLCGSDIFSTTGHSAFSRDDLAAGRFVNSQLSDEPAGKLPRVLIESDIWSYVNVMIASQHPERFVQNSGFDPVAHEEPLLDPEKPFDGAMLQQLDVALLVFRREDYKDYLEARTEIRKLNEYGPWTVYAFALPRSAASVDTTGGQPGAVLGHAPAPLERNLNR